MIVSLIVAKAANNAIGKNNDLLWRLPSDMKFFTRTTIGKAVITGRKNYESIPVKYRPLPDRFNIVITRNPSYEASGAQVVHSLQEALEYAQGLGVEEAVIIGGGEIYRQALAEDVIHRMYITHVDANYEADAFFPEFQSNQFKAIRLYSQPSDEKHLHGFEIWQYDKL